MSATCVVREANEGDARAIAAVHVSARRAAYEGLVDRDYLDSLTDEAFVGRWERILSGRLLDRRHQVALREGAVVGFVSAGPARDEALDATGEIYALYVAHGAWGTGIGAALLDAAHAWLRAEGWLRASLWVIEGNARARRFYARAGYLTDGATKRERIGQGEVCEVRYARWLASGDPVGG